MMSEKAKGSKSMAAAVTKKVVLVGHCGPDSSYLRMAVMSADKGLQVLMADDMDELEALLKDRHADLLLLNRELSWGFHDMGGVDLIRKLRHLHPDVKMMLVSNYPDAQAAAVAAGGMPGFGKREIGTPRVGQVIRDALG
jgi:two-component system, chemotaxis family, chemotaxis protein CheY